MKTLVALLALLAFAACSTPDTKSRIDPGGPDPVNVPFKPVANALVRRCGSLDCHGSIYRNMRLYGYGGLRLDPNATPDRGGRATDDEVARDYDAVVGLEPDIMREVVAAGGAGADRLTFVRKGRGDENHKGGSPIAHGDDADKCVLSWLASNVDTASCAKVADEP